MSKTITETIRETMIATGMNDLELSKVCGVNQPALWGFRNQKRDLKGSTLDKLADYLDLELVPRKRKKK